MNTQQIEDFIKPLVDLSDAGLLLVVLWGIGFVCKKWPVFPNKYVPHALLAMGGLAYPFLSEGKAAQREVFEGIAIGGLAVGLHQAAKVLPIPDWLKKVLGAKNGETEQIEKPKGKDENEHNGPDV